MQIAYDLARVLAIATALLIASSAFGQSYPYRPIRMITSLSAGGGGGLFLRQILPQFTESIAQTVVVDHRTGAGGLLAAETVARAEPDGYTILASAEHALVMRPFLTKTPGVDVFKDLVPITEMWKATTLIMVGPALPVKSLGELIERAKASPGKLSYGTSGFGTGNHLTGELIGQLTGARMVHVPYKGGILAAQATLAGEIPIFIGLADTVIPMMRSGKVRVLAMLEGKRFGIIPTDVPSASDVIPGFQPLASWIGLFGPVGLPRPRIERLGSAFAKAVQAPELRARTNEDGFELIGSTPKEFAIELKKQFELIGRIAKAAKIQPIDH